MCIELVLELRQFVIQIDEWRLRRLEHERRIWKPETSLVPTCVLLVVTCVHLHQVLQQVRVVVLETKNIALLHDPIAGKCTKMTSWQHSVWTNSNQWLQLKVGLLIIKLPKTDSPPCPTMLRPLDSINKLTPRTDISRPVVAGPRLETAYNQDHDLNFRWHHPSPGILIVSILG